MTGMCVGCIDIQIERVKGDEPMTVGVPQFIHDCETCIFLGRYDGSDLYFHEETEHQLDTLIARFGSYGPAYCSGMAFVGTHKHITEAHRRAVERGLLPEKELGDSTYLTENNMNELKNDDAVGSLSDEALLAEVKLRGLVSSLSETHELPQMGEWVWVKDGDDFHVVDYDCGEEVRLISFYAGECQESVLGDIENLCGGLGVESRNRVRKLWGMK